MAITVEDCDKMIAACKEAGKMLSVGYRLHFEPYNLEMARIYNYLLANSYLQALTLDSVAANFNLSNRSLQRKLKEEGVTYQQIVEEVRRKLAINYLTSNYSIKDISHILGYNEQSAFVRAFKRWTNKTPMEYRGRA
jgi:AraC-like DNA-binding protein